MALWDSSLPQEFEKSGFSEKLPDNRITTGMAYGPPKVRKRSTSEPTILRGSMYMTDAQLATFKTFWEDNQALAWTWTRTTVGSVLDYRFVGAPTITKVGTGWRVSFSVEER